MLEEENSYFKNVVKDAVNELKDKGNTCVFFQEQVDAIRKMIKGEIKVNFDGTFYKIKLIKEENNNAKGKKL